MFIHRMEVGRKGCKRSYTSVKPRLKQYINYNKNI